MTHNTTQQAQPQAVLSSAELGKLYADRDHCTQGEHYMRHIDAMTRECLHAKSDIAGELAHRDIEIERLRDALRWIPVTQRLPEKNTEVLIAFAGQCAIPATGQYTGSAFDSHGWCYPAENRGTANDGEDPVVTHWMALPEVPNTAIEQRPKAV